MSAKLPLSISFLGKTERKNLLNNKMFQIVLTVTSDTMIKVSEIPTGDDAQVNELVTAHW